MRRLTAVVMLLAFGPASGVLAQHVQVEGRAGAGYDGNPLFAAAPGQRREDLEEEPPVDPDGVAAIEAEGQLQSGAGLFGAARMHADARLYFRGDVIAFESVRLLAGLRDADRTLSLGLALEASRYDTTASPDASVAGLTEIRAVWSPPGVLGLDARGFGGVRRYDEGEQIDGVVGGGLLFSFRPDPVLVIRIGADAERRETVGADSSRTEVAPRVSIDLLAGPLEITAGYTLFLRDFDAAERDGVEHVASLESVVMLGRAVGLFADAELAAARGDERALVYDRFEALGGLVIRLEAGHEHRPPVAGIEADPDQGPARILGRGRVRFRVHRPGARGVAVVGTFNGWSPEAGRLRPTGGGWFEATLGVRPGHHRYHLVIDGQPVVPEGARRYLPDDFGGRDAVLLVP